jgi:hypothetical protein
VTPVVVQRPEWYTDGQYSARLGDPNYACEGGGPANGDKYGVTQVFDVPYSGPTTLIFDYKIVTQDSFWEARGDYLQIEINGIAREQIGWPGDPFECLGSPYELADSYHIDLLSLGLHRGEGVTFGVFIVLGDQNYNTYAYIDNVRWGP